MESTQFQKDIPLRGSSLNIVRRCGPALGDVLHSKFGCNTIFQGVDFDSDQSTALQKKPTVVPKEVFSAKLKAGVKVSVWKADLTNFAVDAVVNAANAQLQHYGGLAQALSEAGGPRIQQECDDYIKKYGDLKTGGAIIGSAGLLPCRNIIHAVGPQLSKYSDVSRAEPLLKKAIRSILDIVKEKRFKTVAIPAISSGLFNYPLRQCAETIVQTVKHYYEGHFSQGHLPDEILLMNHDDPTVMEMDRACHLILDPHTSTMSYSQAAAGKSAGAGKTSIPIVQIGNVTLILEKGKIEEQQTDVIVNTISPDRKLNLGEISNALLQKAGYEMQKEINSASEIRNVISTKGYKLHCKEVYHTCCTAYSKTAAKQVFFSSVSECLKRALERDHKSIAFPAIGTGHLGFSKTESATIMSEAVANFAQYGWKMMVHFVIHPSDDYKYKAFEEQIRSLQSFTHATEHNDDLHDTKTPNPLITLVSCSDEAVHEADHWLSGLLGRCPETICIYNNFIQHFGEQEYKQLSRLTQQGVSVDESFAKGRASITVKGHSHVDVVVAGLQVEAMLCKVQKDFVTEEEHNMYLMSTEEASFKRTTITHTVPMLSDVISAFRQQGLHVVKMEKVENPMLQTLFDLKTQQLKCSNSQRMFQLIPAQFCEMVCRIGFQAEYAPPEDPAFGEGIYFAPKIHVAMKLWKEQSEEFFYFVEAEVLTGNSTPGKPGLILPPAVRTDPQIRYDSVSGKHDVTVIFSTYQALPKHIITCKKMMASSRV